MNARATGELRRRIIFHGVAVDPRLDAQADCDDMNAARHLAALVAICWAVGAVAEAPPTDQDRQDALVCRTLLWASASGVVQLAQVVDTAGSFTLDALCLNAVIARRIEPSSGEAPRTGRWIMFTTRLLMGLPHNEAVAARDRPKRSIPTLQHDGPFDLNRSLETTPDQSRPLTVCALHVFVSAQGKVEKLGIATSTGVPSLDRACEKAIESESFIAAQRDGQAVAATTDIWLNFASGR